MTASKLALALIAGSLSGAASASTSLTAQQILEQFNLVTLEGATTSSHVHGRAYIGGDLISPNLSEYVNTNANEYLGPSDYAGLTVAGSASNLHVNRGGAVIGGNLNDAIVQNGGTAVVFGNATNSHFNDTVKAYVKGSSSITDFNNSSEAVANAATALETAKRDFGTTLTGLSTSLSHLASTGSSVTFDGGKATFNAVAKNGLAVFDLTAKTSSGEELDDLVFSKGEFDFRLNGATTVIINVDEGKVTSRANFPGGSAQGLASNVIWNFYNTTDINFEGQFGGTVLATKALLKSNSDIEGNVYVRTLTQQGQIHAFEFQGNVTAVPEPETYAMMLGGLALMAGIARRRRDA